MTGIASKTFLLLELHVLQRLTQILIVLVCCSVRGQQLKAEAITKVPDLTPSPDLADDIARNMKPFFESYDPKAAKREQQQLIARGAEIFPGVVYILQTNSDTVVIRNTLRLVEQMQCDKSPLLPFIRDLLKRKEPELRSCGAFGLGLLGNRSDIDSLLVMLGDPNENFDCRIHAADAIVQLGDHETSLRLEGAIEKRKALVPPEEWSKDKVLIESTRAVNQLEAKLQKQPPSNVDNPLQQKNGPTFPSRYLGFVFAGIIGFVLGAGCTWAFLRWRRYGVLGGSPR